MRMEKVVPRSDAEKIVDLNRTVERLMDERNSLHTDVLRLRADVKELKETLLRELI